MVQSRKTAEIPVIIYCAWSFKPGAVVALKFPDEAVRIQFQNFFLNTAKNNNVDFSKILTTFSDTEHKPTLYFNPAPKEASEKGLKQPGSYIAKNGELAIDFVNPKLRDAFIEMTNLECSDTLEDLGNKIALAPSKNDPHANAIYFNIKQLPPQYDPTHRVNIKGAVSL